MNMTKNSVIVGYHTNPFTCGIARFNDRLAEELAVPTWSWSRYCANPIDHALLSVKLSEFDGVGIAQLDTFMQKSHIYDLFVHGLVGSEQERQLICGARMVFSGSRSLAFAMKSYRPDVRAAFAPGLSPQGSPQNMDISMITFGMAHKISAEWYGRLADILKDDPRSSILEISSALHEGTRFDAEFFAVADEIRSFFAGRVRFLGFLSDDEVSRRLSNSNAMIAFFPQGVRENNTSVMGAMAHGCPVITNLDVESPSWMIHDETLFDIRRLLRFPDTERLQEVGTRARDCVQYYTYRELARIISNN